MKWEGGIGMMLIQSPSAETCRSYVGKHVCAVLKDGTQVYGTIKGVSDHGLELGDAAPRATILSTNPGIRSLRRLWRPLRLRLRLPAGIRGFGLDFHCFIIPDTVPLHLNRIDDIYTGASLDVN